MTVFHTAGIPRSRFGSSKALLVFSIFILTVTHNSMGVSASSGGIVTSFGNNRFIGNTTDGDPSSTIAER